MKPADDIKRLIKQSHITTDSDADEKILTDAIKYLSQLKQTRSTALQPNVWRIIMKRNTIKLAVTVAIIVAVAVGINRFVGPIDGITVALGQVREAMRSIGWMHVVSNTGDGYTEQWYSFESKVTAIDKNGEVTYWDYGQNIEQYVYDPDTDTLTVSDVSGGMIGHSADTPFGLIATLVQAEQETGAKLTRRIGQYEDRQAEIWELVRSADNVVEKLELFVDIEKHLPIAIEMQCVKPDGSVMSERKTVFEYPEEGPKNIHEMGVPQTAKVVHLAGPSPDIMDIAASHDGRRRLLGDFRGLTMHTHEQGHVAFTVFEYQGKKDRHRHGITGGLADYDSKPISQLVESMVSGDCLILSNATSNSFPVTVFPHYEIPPKPTMEEYIKNCGIGGWKLITSNDPELSEKVGCQLESYSNGAASLHTWWIDPPHDYWVSRFTYELLEAGTNLENAPGLLLRIECEVTSFTRTIGGQLYPRKIVLRRFDKQGNVSEEHFDIYMEEIAHTPDIGRAFATRALKSLLQRE